MTADAISTAQRNRLALVYIRQSSPRQVVHTLESQRRQRGFASRAAELDWPANRIRLQKALPGCARQDLESVEVGGYWRKNQVSGLRSLKYWASSP